MFLMKIDDDKNDRNLTVDNWEKNNFNLIWNTQMFNNLTFDWIPTRYIVFLCVSKTKDSEC